MLLEGANSFLLEHFLVVWKITFTRIGDLAPLNVTIFITHMHICVMGAMTMKCNGVSGFPQA